MCTDAKDKKDFEDFFVSSRDSSLRLPDFEKKKAGGVVAVAVVPIDLDRYGHGALPLRRRRNWSVTTTTTSLWIFV